MSVQVDVKDSEGRLVQRRFIAESEERFWAIVDAFMVHTADELRIFAKSRRLVQTGNKLDLAKAIATHDQINTAMDAGLWSQAMQLIESPETSDQFKVEYVQSDPDRIDEVQLELAKQLFEHAKKHAAKHPEWQTLLDYWSLEGTARTIGRTRTFNGALYKLHGLMLEHHKEECR